MRRIVTRITLYTGLLAVCIVCGRYWSEMKELQAVPAPARPSSLVRGIIGSKAPPPFITTPRYVTSVIDSSDLVRGAGGIRTNRYLRLDCEGFAYHVSCSGYGSGKWRNVPLDTNQSYRFHISLLDPSAWAMTPDLYRINKIELGDRVIYPKGEHID